MNFSKLLGPEKRKNPERTSCSWPVRFHELGRDRQAGQKFHVAKCKRVSESGIEITSIIPLTPKRFVLIEVDLKMLETSVPTANLLIVSGTYILTEVERRHLNLETGLFEAGLKFIDVSRTEEFELVLKQIPGQFS
jgi:hypothetical protein